MKGHDDVMFRKGFLKGLCFLFGERRTTNQLISQLVEPMADAGTGKEVVRVEAGDAYIFDGHESHYLKGGPDGAHIVCIFTPACTGLEVSSKNQLIFSSFPFTFLSCLRYEKTHQNLHLMHIFDVHFKNNFLFQKTQEDGSFPLLE